MKKLLQKLAALRERGIDICYVIVVWCEMIEDRFINPHAGAIRAIIMAVNTAMIIAAVYCITAGLMSGSISIIRGCLSSIPVIIIGSWVYRHL